MRRGEAAGAGEPLALARRRGPKVRSRRCRSIRAASLCCRGAPPGRGGVSGGDAEFCAGTVDGFADGWLALPGGQGCVEFGHVVHGPAGLDAGEDVDAAVAEFEAVVEVAGLEVGGGDDREGACRRSG